MEAIEKHHEVLKDVYEYVLENRIIYVSNTDLIDKVKDLQIRARELLEENPFEQWEYLEDFDSRLYNEEEMNAIQNRIPYSSLILMNTAPSSYPELFKNLDKNYIYGMYDDVFIDCRKIIEGGIKRILEQRKDPEYIKLKQNNKAKLNVLIERCKELDFINKVDVKIAHHIRLKANSILHTQGEKEKLLKPRESVLMAIRCTFDIVDKFFGKPEKKTRLQSVKA